MRKTLLTATILWTVAASAQSPTPTMIEACRNFSMKQAALIARAQREKIDLHRLTVREPRHWADGVGNYMLQSAGGAPHLAEHEIASIGYAYCLERRPAGT